MNVGDVQKRLEKRQTFLIALEELSAYVERISTDDDGFSNVFSLVCRVYSLLKSRYTNVEYWEKSLRLFNVAKDKARVGSQIEKINQIIGDVFEFLKENSGSLNVGPASENSTQGRPNESILESRAAPTMNEANALSDRPTVTNDGNSSRREALLSVLQGLQSVLERLDAVAEGALRMEAGMDEMDQLILEAGGSAAARRRACPPASAKLLKTLPRHTVMEDDLKTDGPYGGCVCAVCTETVAVGDELLPLPCKHTFHSACVSPWLERSNVCPICRRELPTDDPAYEAQKEADAEAEAERRGAANAINTLEFLYT